MTAPANEMHEDRGRWIPLLFIAGLALLVVVQAGFAWLAIRSDPGVATPNAYERGLAHNAVLRQAAGEAALGWRIAVEPRAGVARRGTLVVTASDAQARPLDGLTVTGLVQRPTRAGLDLRLAFHFIGAGRYQADYELPLAGLWALDLLLERDGVQVQHAVRFSVP